MKIFTKVRKLTLDNISTGKEKIKIGFLLTNRIKRLVFTLTNIFYLFNSLSNIDSLGLLNNMDIYYYYKTQTIYNLEI